MQKLPLLLIAFALPFFSLAEKWHVGPGLTYTVPSQVAPLVNAGDTIEIEAAEYLGDVCAWTKNNLVIIGVNGRPHLKANGNNAMGKGTWVFVGNNITVENIEFSGAAVPDENGAGIRLDGIGLHAVNCYFHDNENGILTGNNGGKVTIENCEFGYNGDGVGYAHNIYIGRIDTAIIRASYFHHAKVGHEFKSRAGVNYILYNRFSNEATGTASRNVDLPNGGLSYLIGNIFQQGANSANGNIVGYGLEGLSNVAPHALYIINNSFVNDRTNGSFLHVQDGLSTIEIYNNIFAGTGTVLNYAGNVNAIDSATNLVQPDISAVGFAEPTAYNYEIAPNAPPENLGSDPGTAYGFSLSATHEYMHNAQSRTRTILAAIDIGAYETSGILPLTMIDLNAALNEGKAIISWTTEHEQNIIAFEIQRSSDGISFENIGRITADNNALNNYKFTDNFFSSNNIYYRLKIIEQQVESFSNTIALKLSTRKVKPAISTAGSTWTISLPAESTKSKTAMVRLYDYSGRQLVQQQLLIENNKMRFNAGNLHLNKQPLIIAIDARDNKWVIPFLAQ